MMYDMTDLWPAPSIADPVRATLALPGSKSMTNRAYVLAALASGPSTLVGPLRSRDTDLMEAALAALGVQFTHDGDTVHVQPARCAAATSIAAWQAP